MQSKDVTLNDLVVRFDAIDSRLDGIDSRLEKIETRLDRVEVRLDGVEVRLGDLETRTTKLENTVAVVAKDVEGIKVGLNHTNDKIEWIQTTIYWGFAIIAFVAAFVSIARDKKEAPQERREPEPPVRDDFSFQEKRKILFRL